MAGLFGFFNRKKESVEQVKPKDAFFLSPDDAKTFGDIEYMRTPNVVKRTFAKTINGGDLGESIKSVSALEEKVLNANELESKKAAEKVSSSFETPSYTPERRPNPPGEVDFRKMAGDINKNKKR
ncbi:MAG: hypothetical protein WCO81_12145 [Cyanobacteriota bacterium ELA615]|jgi:hypothetical protein